LPGPAGTSGVQIGSDGIVLVNAGSAAATDKVLAALKTLTELPIRYIINADAGADFVAATRSWRRPATRSSPTRSAAAGDLPNGGGASILAHDSV